jgi:hypothetical protein
MYNSNSIRARPAAYQLLPVHTQLSADVRHMILLNISVAGFKGRQVVKEGASHRV